MELLLYRIPEVCFFIKDRDYRFVTGNKALLQLLGTPSLEDLVGKTDEAFTPDFLAAAFREDDRSVMEEGNVILDQIELVPTTETLEWRSTCKIPLYDSDDQVIGLAGMTREINDSDSVFQDHPEMHTIVHYIQAHYRESLTKADMAAAAGISISTLERRFRQTFGIPPGHYARKIRLNAACQKLRNTECSLMEIAEACGFFDQASMTHAFRSEIKITPHRYRQRFCMPSTESNPTKESAQGIER